MEPDLYVFAGAPAGVSGAHAGDHIVGPSQGEGGGERIPGRGKKTKPHPLGILTDSISANPLQLGQALNKALGQGLGGPVLVQHGRGAFYW